MAKFLKQIGNKTPQSKNYRNDTFQQFMLIGFQITTKQTSATRDKTYVILFRSAPEVGTTHVARKIYTHKDITHTHTHTHMQVALV